MKHTTFEKRFKDVLKTVEFTNEFGEVYKIYSCADIAIAIAGDETDWNVIPLFHPSFNIWSREELAKLGKALQQLTIEE